MTIVGAWVAVFLMVSFTVYGQIMLKSRVLAAGPVGSSAGEIALYLIRLLLDPWVITCFAAGLVAALCWMAALSRLSLATAYPFIAVTVVAVAVLNAWILHEPLRPLHFAGMALIAAGLVAISQA